MGYHAIEPEVAGGWGENTRVKRIAGQPDIVEALDYEFDGWGGDELLESTPCFIVTERLANEIVRAGLSGIVFDHVEISKSGQFEDWYPGRTLPKFLWMKVEGEAGRDDFGINSDLILVVSDRALAVLKSGQLDNAIIEPLKTPAR